MAYAKREKFKCFEFFKTKYDNVKKIKKNQCEVVSSFYDIDKQLDLFLKCKPVKSSTIKFQKQKEYLMFYTQTL